MCMNPGNNNRNGLDSFIERLNKGFGKLLGKKNTPVKPSQTSNATFSIIILFSCLILWGCTGFYFLGENEYGLIFINGKVTDVKKGIRIGITLPYPFGDAEIIDGEVIQLTSLGAASGNSFIVLDKNLSPVSISAKFSYQITDPKKLYLNRLQDQDELNNEIIWQVQSKIANYISSRDINELKNTNFTVLSKEILDQVKTVLDSYGITMVKFVIVNIQEQINQTIIELPKVESTHNNASGEINIKRSVKRQVNRDRNGLDN